VRWRVLGPIVSLLAAACGGADGPDEPAMKMTGSQGTTDVPMDTSSTGGPDVPGDRCDEAVAVEPGRRYGSLAGAQPDAGGICGTDGPAVFLQVAIDRRADLEVNAVGEGFAPIVAVLETCGEPRRELACTQGLPTTVLDLSAGSDPIVAIAVSPEDPALENDGLAFAVDLDLRAVLGIGEACEPAHRGRCETGSACLPDDEDVARCTALVGDTCASAEPHALASAAPLEVTIDPIELQTDAHHHSCTGARRAERVLRLALPDDLAPGTALRITTDAADVGLAVRGATCLPDDELGCAAPSDAGIVLAVADVPGRIGSDHALYLFVELPMDAGEIDPTPTQGELAPFAVTIELVPGR